MVKPTKSSDLSSSFSLSSSNSSPKYKGVRKRKWGKWVSEVRLPNSRERIWLGSYDTAEKAARAFDAAQFCLRGDPAKFMNFPDNPPEIINGRFMSATEIQVAAARFANSDPEPRDSISGPLDYSDLSSLSSSSSLLLHLESQSNSVVQADGEMTEMTLDSGFADMFLSLETANNNEYDLGMFSGFDDLAGDFLIPPLPNIDPDEDNYDGFSSQGSLLWNF